jgi:Na+/H+ antiporter NhaD/arsenite permease-like protein
MQVASQVTFCVVLWLFKKTNAYEFAGIPIGRPMTIVVWDIFDLGFVAVTQKPSPVVSFWLVVSYFHSWFVGTGVLHGFSVTVWSRSTVAQTSAPTADWSWPLGRNFHFSFASAVVPLGPAHGPFPLGPGTAEKGC